MIFAQGYNCDVTAYITHVSTETEGALTLLAESKKTSLIKYLVMLMAETSGLIA